MGKVPHEDNDASRDNEKNRAHVTDDFLHVDPATRVLRENPFQLLSPPPDMHEEKNDVVLSPTDLQEEIDDVAFSFPEVHPPAILRMFSAFVPRQRAFVPNPACAVDKNNAVQRAALADREGDMARHPGTCDACILRSGLLTR